MENIKKEKNNHVCLIISFVLMIVVEIYSFLVSNIFNVFIFTSILFYFLEQKNKKKQMNYLIQCCDAIIEQKDFSIIDGESKESLLSNKLFLLNKRYHQSLKAVKKEQLREARLKEYLNQQREIKHQEAVIEKLRSFNREKSIKRAESREKMLDKMTLVDKPMEINTDIHLKLEPSRVSGNDVLSVKGLSKAFPPQTLFTDISFEIKRGEHIAIIGDNGTGKTTLLKILNNVIQADSGSFTLGANVEIGYYDQEHHVLHMDKTIFEEISDDYPTLTNTQIRNMLAAFLFTGDDVFKLIGDLSGGERGRVSLAKLMLSNANFLILDEPTNHLDITSKEILERALNDYTGTILYVSHDRYFINQTATRILELTGNTFVNYIGNYDYYLEKKDLLTPAVSTAASEDTPAQVSESKLSWQEQKEEQARLRKRQNDLKKTEERIGVLETRNGKIDELMMQEEVYTNSVKCQELAKEKAANEAELEELYEKWEELAE
jgi:ATP-binding cassette subfamily F protein 3